MPTPNDTTNTTVIQLPPPRATARGVGTGSNNKMPKEWQRRHHTTASPHPGGRRASGRGRGPGRGTGKQLKGNNAGWTTTGRQEQQKQGRQGANEKTPTKRERRRRGGAEEGDTSLLDNRFQISYIDIVRWQDLESCRIAFDKAPKYQSCVLSLRHGEVVG